jgi:hypothetical protein
MHKNMNKIKEIIYGSMHKDMNKTKTIKNNVKKTAN